MVTKEGAEEVNGWHQNNIYKILRWQNVRGYLPYSKISKNILLVSMFLNIFKKLVSQVFDSRIR